MVFLKTVVYNNSLLTWLLAVLVMLLVLGCFYIIKKSVIRRLSVVADYTSTDLDNNLIEIVKKTKLWFLLILSMYTGLLLLDLPPEVGQIVNKVAVITLLLQTAFWANDFISYMLQRFSLDDSRSRATTAVALGYIGRIFLFSIIALLVLDNLGIEINALIAGLGIGGIAVALALQTVLGDLLGSLSIVLDKPFVIGDFVIIDDLQGTVENVGLKSTRIRSLSGEQLVFSNHDLLSSRIRNYKRMNERRVVFQIGVAYETPHEKLEAIPGLIKEIIESQQEVRFGRAHFMSYGAFSLDFEVVYFVLNPDYTFFMDIQQSINLAIFRSFEENQIVFAYPTQTLYVNRGS